MLRLLPLLTFLSFLIWNVCACASSTTFNLAKNVTSNFVLYNGVQYYAKIGTLCDQENEWSYLTLPGSIQISIELSAWQKCDGKKIEFTSGFSYNTSAITHQFSVRKVLTITASPGSKYYFHLKNQKKNTCEYILAMYFADVSNDTNTTSSNNTFTNSTGTTTGYPPNPVNTSCTYRCENGDCVQSPSQCINTFMCPPLMRKCPRNICVEVGKECPAFSCAIGEQQCEDGSCATLTSQCPEYEGCPIGRLLCPSGECKANLSDCLCEDSQFKCFDGRCVEGMSMCVEAPYLRNARNQVIQMNATSSNELIPIFARDEKECSVTIVSAGLLNRTVTVKIHSIADSFLRDSARVENMLSMPFDFSINLQGDSLQNVTVSCEVTIPIGMDISKICLGYYNNYTKRFECDRGVVTLAGQGDNIVATSTATKITSYSFMFDDLDGTEKSNSSAASYSKGVHLYVIVAVVAAFMIMITGMVVVAFYKNSLRKVELSALDVGPKKRSLRIKDLMKLPKPPTSDPIPNA